MRGNGGRGRAKRRGADRTGKKEKNEWRKDGARLGKPF